MSVTSGLVGGNGEKTTFDEFHAGAAEHWRIPRPGIIMPPVLTERCLESRGCSYRGPVCSLGVRRLGESRDSIGPACGRQPASLAAGKRLSSPARVLLFSHLQ